MTTLFINPDIRLNAGQILLVVLMAFALMALVLTLIYHALRNLFTGIYTIARNGYQYFKPKKRPLKNTFKSDDLIESERNNLRDALYSFSLFASIVIILVHFVHGK